MKRKFLTVIILSVGLGVGARAATPAVRKSPPKTIVASEAGIVGDARTLNTIAIQQAVDRLSSAGGGTLVFSEGVFKSGCIILKDGVTLQLERNAVLSGSTNPADYKSLVPSEAGDNSTLALIVADKASHIRITGSGLIDGNGRALAIAIDSLRNAPTEEEPNGPDARFRTPETMRPKLLFFSDCEDVLVEGLNLRNSACWGLSFHGCKNLTVRDIDFVNRAYWNNDGIDITDCEDVIVRRCQINSADDGICLKSYNPASCNRRVLIEDCDIISSASAVKFGTASWGGFRDITVRNIRARDTYRSAIALECVDGGTLENVLVEDIYAVNMGNPIFIRLGHRGGKAPGRVKGIVIRNVFVEMAYDMPDINYDMRGPDFESVNPRPSSIVGIPGHCIEDVLLENIELVYPGRASKGLSYYPLEQVNQVPELPGNYPEFCMFGELPAWGFYIRHARGVRFRNVRLSLKEADYRYAFILEDARGIRMEQVSLPVLGSGGSVYSIDSELETE